MDITLTDILGLFVIGLVLCIPYGIVYWHGYKNGKADGLQRKP